MKQDIIPKVTEETFPEAWDYAAKKHAKVRQSRLIASLLEPICHFLFLAEALFLTFGLAYTYVPVPALKTLLRKIPQFSTTWARFLRYVLHRFELPDVLPELVWDILLSFLLATLVPLVIGLIITAVVRLLYHPRRAPMPACETREEKARHLLTLVRKTQYHQGKMGINGSLISGAIYLLVVTVTVLMVYFSLPQEQQTAILSSMGALFILSFPAVYFVYAAIDYPLYLLVGLMYRCPLPKAFTADIREFVKASLTKKEAAALLAVPIRNFGGLRRIFSILTDKFFKAPAVAGFLTKPMGFPCPVTPESYTDAWNWTSRKLYWAKKKLVIRKITSLFVYPYFAVMLFAMVFGDLHDLKNPIVSMFLQNWEMLNSFWAKIRPILSQGLGGSELMGWRILLLYVLPIGFIVLVTLFVLLVYHPRKPQPDGTQPAAEQSRALYRMISDANLTVKRSTSSMSGFCHATFFCLGTIILVLFLGVCYGDPAVAAAAQGHIGSILKNCLLLFFGLLLGYPLLRLPVDLCMLMTTFCYVPPRALQEAEDYMELTDKEPQILPVSEEKEDISCPNQTIKN